MSLRSDGAYRCDRCGADVVNGSVEHAAIVSDAVDGAVRVLHFCRQPHEGAPHGCVGRLLSPSMLADYQKEK